MRKSLQYEAHETLSLSGGGDRSALQTVPLPLIRLSLAFCSVSDHSLCYSELTVPSVSVSTAQLAADAPLDLSTLV